jgi:hypothetical protein
VFLGPKKNLEDQVALARPAQTGLLNVFQKDLLFLYELVFLLRHTSLDV